MEKGKKMDIVSRTHWQLVDGSVHLTPRAHAQVLLSNVPLRKEPDRWLNTPGACGTHTLTHPKTVCRSYGMRKSPKLGNEHIKIFL